MHFSKFQHEHEQISKSFVFIVDVFLLQACNQSENNLSSNYFKLKIDTKQKVQILMRIIILF